MKKQSKLQDVLLKRGMTEQDVLDILESAKQLPSRTVYVPLKTRKVRYGYISDSHIGHKKFDCELFNRAVYEFKGNNVDFIVHAGDHVEGMSGRPGHIYELTHVGFEEQVRYAVELYKRFGKIPIFGIDGNHDFWYVQKNDSGAYVGRTLSEKIDNYHHLGEWEGDLRLGDDITLKLFHANDGTAYATSYKLQKLIESFTGGEKPNIVHSGHYHKAMSAFIRNVHGFESGTLCGQSGFMRGKKIPAHKGFGIVEIEIAKGSIESLKHEFFPGYE